MTIISFIILSMILTYGYKKFHKYWVKFSNFNSKHKNKKSKIQNNSNRVIKSSLFSHLIPAMDPNRLSDGRIIMPSDDPDKLPPLPRYPLSGRANKPANKTNRRLSPWGGTIGENYDD